MTSRTKYLVLVLSIKYAKNVMMVEKDKWFGGGADGR